MDNVVPGALRRLREADIIGMAGLKLAALGQEYCRIGAVYATTRQGAQLAGIVEVPPTAHEKAASPVKTVAEGRALEDNYMKPGSYPVTVEIRGRSTWSASCSCSLPSETLYVCPHIAALLYQWLAHPMSFVPAGPSEETTPINGMHNGEGPIPPALLEPIRPLEYDVPEHNLVPQEDLSDMLLQLSLSDLRNIAREYEITRTSLNKQQLVEALMEALRQPEIVRKVVGTLEKPQRQLLAALTLAGGVVSDDDLRGLYERFSIGYHNQFQDILTVLRSKCLLLRTTFNTVLQQQSAFPGSLLEVGWYVPSEVRSALRITIPITTFDIHAERHGAAQELQILQARPLHLLEDLLLVARALDGYQLASEDQEAGQNGLHTTPALAKTPTGGPMPVPAPRGTPSATLLKSLQASLSLDPSLLRFSFHLLRLVDILFVDDIGTTSLRILPNAARLLLGPVRAEAAYDLFRRWLTALSYTELFELQEEGLQLCCRSGPPGRPALRTGELEMQNSRARQAIVALLEQVPLNQWINFSAFARFIYRLNPLFLQKQRDLFSTPPWWLEQDASRPLRPTRQSDWLRAEGRYIARLLQGPLHWWGICDLALSAGGQLLAFRLTPMATFFLKHTPLDWQTDEDRQDSSTLLGTSENGEVLVSCRSSAWPLIELLEEFAETAGVQAGRLCYRLTAQSLSRAIGNGLHPANLLQLLRQYAGPGKTLAALLAQLERRMKNYGRVRLYTNVALLEVADMPVMRELAAIMPLEEQIVRPINSTLHILKKQGAERILQELKRRGQVPLLHEEEDYGAE